MADKEEVDSLKTLVLSIDEKCNMLIGQGKTTATSFELLENAKKQLNDNIPQFKIFYSECTKQLINIGLSISNVINDLKTTSKSSSNVIEDFKSLNQKFEVHMSTVKLEVSNIAAMIKPGELIRFNNQNRFQQYSSTGCNRISIITYEKFTCQQCHSTFFDLEHLKHHVILHAHPLGTNKYKCNICNEIVDDLVNLSIHCLSDLHFKNIARAIEIRMHEKITCHTCNTTIINVKSLEAHFRIKVHLANLACSCYICKLDFYDTNSVILHLKSNQHITNSGKTFLKASEIAVLTLYKNTY